MGGAAFGGVSAMTFKKSNEAFWWSLFSAGGVLSAMFLPAFVVISGLILPNQSSADPGRAPYEHLTGSSRGGPCEYCCSA